jgi:hypothetical protein
MKIFKLRIVLGLGVGYNLFYIDVEIDGSKFIGDVDYKFQGVNVFGVLRF